MTRHSSLINQDKLISNRQSHLLTMTEPGPSIQHPEVVTEALIYFDKHKPEWVSLARELLPKQFGNGNYTPQLEKWYSILMRLKVSTMKERVSDNNRSFESLTYDQIQVVIRLEACIEKPVYLSESAGISNSQAVGGITNICARLEYYLKLF